MAYVFEVLSKLRVFVRGALIKLIGGKTKVEHIFNMFVLLKRKRGKEREKGACILQDIPELLSRCLVDTMA